MEGKIVVLPPSYEVFNLLPLLRPVITWHSGHHGGVVCAFVNWVSLSMDAACPAVDLQPRPDFISASAELCIDTGDIFPTRHHAKLFIFQEWGNQRQMSKARNKSPQQRVVRFWDGPIAPPQSRLGGKRLIPTLVITLPLHTTQSLSHLRSDIKLTLHNVAPRFPSFIYPIEKQFI